MIDSYVNLDLRLSGYAATPDEGARFEVSAASDDVGEQARAETVVMSAELARELAQLERRDFDRSPADLVRLGEAIGALLLPTRAREFFKNALSKLQGTQGLRLRILCVSVELERVPWEFACVESDIEGTNQLAVLRRFLVCQPRISIVRYVVGAHLIAQPRRDDERWRLLVLACEPADMRNADSPLQVDQEIAALETALRDCAAVSVERCPSPTREELRKAMLHGADIFHFAGHGNFARDAAGQVQSAQLMLTTADGGSDPWGVADLSQQLTSKGVRLAVLGACRSAQTDGHNAWAGIAPSLVRAGIPVVVGMQFSVYDDSALAFSKTLYQTLAAGATIDEAVFEARSVIAGGWAKTGRDFATPVLYTHTLESNHWTLPTGAAIAPAARPPGRSLDDALHEIGQLYDAKCVHDALHRARMQPFADIVARSRDFPDGRTRRDLVRNRDALRTYADEVRRVAQLKRCEEIAMTQLSEEFDHAIDVLTQALGQSDSMLLEEAISEFGTLFNYYCVHIDAWMISGAKHLDLESLVAFLDDLGVEAGKALELRRIADQVGAQATQHTLCQRIDNRLLVIRNEPDEAARFQALRRHWKPVSMTLAHFLPDQGGTAEQAELRQHRDRLTRGIENMDPDAATQAFEDFCGAFDFGFYTVDADLKGLCGKMRDSAMSSISELRSH